MPEPLRVVTLCTGNASRSVMLGFMFEALAASEGLDLEVRTAGTHAAEGQGVSARTRDALEALEDLDVDVTTHRSRVLTDDDVAWADVIFAAEGDHLRFVGVRHPEASVKTVQLAAFVREAPLDGDLADRVADVASRGPRDEFDVADPAGGNQATYDHCARELWALAQATMVLLGED